MNKDKRISDLLYEVEISKSKAALDNVCSTKKICESQGPITFGQLRELVENGKLKRIAVHMGEGAYKAILRLVPWFLPQLVLLGFGATWIRVFNKLFRPTLEETTNYKTWWGKTILKIFDLVEGELNANDPLSKIFFISDGLMSMLNDKYKIEFARYIAEVANEQPDDEIVPEYFVENELRKWVNEKFFLDPPLPIKNDGKSLGNVNEIIMEINKKILVEGYKYDSLIRQIVKDIITTYKMEDDGTFFLPEELSNDEEYETEYTLNNLGVSVELTIEESNDVDDFIANAYFVRKEDVIEVKIIYNPEKKEEIIFNLIGELNELIAHEVRHLHQKYTGSHDLDVEDDRPSFEYYSSPEEIDAQVYGFRRMKKITRRPFEELVRNWFKTHKFLHNLNSDEQEEIIKMILDANSKI